MPTSRTPCKAKKHVLEGRVANVHDTSQTLSNTNALGKGWLRARWWERPAPELARRFFVSFLGALFSRCKTFNQKNACAKNIDVCLIDRFITFWIFGKQLRSGVVLDARAMLTSLYKLEKLTITHELKILNWPRRIHTPSWNEVFTFPAPAAIQPFLLLPPCCTLSVQAETPLTHWHVGMGLSCSFLCDGWTLRHVFNTSAKMTKFRYFFVVLLNDFSHPLRLMSSQARFYWLWDSQQNDIMPAHQWQSLILNLIQLQAPKGRCFPVAFRNVWWFKTHMFAPLLGQVFIGCVPPSALNGTCSIMEIANPTDTNLR